MKFDCGRLNKPVHIGTVTFSMDAEGSPVAAVEFDVQHHWAAIEPVGGRELERRGQMEADVDTTIIMRYFAATAALKTKDQLSYVGRIYEIVSIVTPAEYSDHIVMMCREVKAQS